MPPAGRTHQVAVLRPRGWKRVGRSWGAKWKQRVPSPRRKKRSPSRRAPAACHVIRGKLAVGPAPEQLEKVDM